MNVWISRKPFGPLVWGALLETAADSAGWLRGTEVFTFHEGLHECRLDRKGWAGLEPPDCAWEGRLFAEPAELRWTRTRDSLYRGWLVRELPAPAAGPQFEGPLVKQAQQYFLMGRYSEATKGFADARYPGVTFVYPLGVTPAPGTRARIEVTEYRREQPRWGAIGREGVNEQLASALLVEHRFVSVTAG